MDRLSHGGIVPARILIAVAFVLNSLGTVDQTIPTKELIERGARVSWAPVIMLAGRVLELAAGFGLALGVFPRLMALALFAFLVPATFISHSFSLALCERSVAEALCVCGIASAACAFAVLGWFPHLRRCDS
jgi:uncharacterized membrane protein YphA (DoxX/SURF4 family)